MRFTNPQSAVLQLGLREGMNVGDLGCGSGHYTLALSPIVGDTGRVYAVDVQEDILIRLKDDAARRGFINIETVWGNLEKVGGTKLKDQSLDAVVLSNTLFQLENKEEAIQEITRVLKPGGRLLVIDWTGPHGGMGPEEQFVIEETAAEALFTRVGYTKVKAFEAGAHHYSIVLSAPTV